MCFGLSGKVEDPTQQPIRFTESNEARMSEGQKQEKRRKSSYKNRPAFVDVTNKESNFEAINEPPPMTRKMSHGDVEAAHPNPKRAAKHRSHHGPGMPAWGADFGATAVVGM